MAHNTPIAMAAPPEVYRKRRAAVASKLKRPLVIFSGHAQARNYPANTYPFHAGSTYRYFGGPPLENAALAIDPESDGERGCALYRPPTTIDDAVWMGPRPTDAAFAHAAGLRPADVRDSTDLEWAVAGHDAAGICTASPNTIAWMRDLNLSWATREELTSIVDLRLCKDEHELQAMRRAAEITIEGQRAALAACRPGGTEAAAAAAFYSLLVRHHSRPSFTPIITVHGEILHSEGHPHSLEAGRLLLIDAGAEEPTGYASDATRTVPVDGRWSDVQRHLYDTVERAVHTACDACVPGRRFRDVHDLAARVICEGLVQAELLRGDPAELTQRVAHSLFFTHGLGHLIGLDVHDMEDFGDVSGYAAGRERRPEFGNKFLRLDRDLLPGMTLTIEPGIYLVPDLWAHSGLTGPFEDVVNRPQVEALLRDKFGGIRVEHTICVRESGPPEILTAALPTTAEEIAALVGTR